MAKELVERLSPSSVRSISVWSDFKTPPSQRSPVFTFPKKSFTTVHTRDGESLTLFDQNFIDAEQSSDYSSRAAAASLPSQRSTHSDVDDMIGRYHSTKQAEEKYPDSLVSDMMLNDSLNLSYVSCLPNDVDMIVENAATKPDKKASKLIKNGARGRSKKTSKAGQLKALKSKQLFSSDNEDEEYEGKGNSYKDALNDAVKDAINDAVNHDVVDDDPRHAPLYGQYLCQISRFARRLSAACPFQRRAPQTVTSSEREEARTCGR